MKYCSTKRRTLRRGGRSIASSLHIRMSSCNCLETPWHTYHARASGGLDAPGEIDREGLGLAWSGKGSDLEVKSISMSPSMSSWGVSESAVSASGEEELGSRDKLRVSSVEPETVCGVVGSRLRVHRGAEPPS
jgi:hypothetical protein